MATIELFCAIWGVPMRDARKGIVQEGVLHSYNRHKQG